MGQSRAGREPIAEMDRREQILAGAARAFARKGYHGTTIKDIATEAGLAPGTLYLYFENKRGILTGFFDYAIGLAEERLQGLPAVPMEQALVALLAERLAFMREHTDLVKVILTEAMFDDELREKVAHNVVDRIGGLVGRFVRRHTGVQVPEERLQPIVRALQAQLIFSGVLAPALIPESCKGPAQDAAEICAVLLHGIEGVLKELE